MSSTTQAGVDARKDIEETLDHILPRKPLPQYIDDTLFLEVKTLLKKHPDGPIKEWHKNPRIYTLLRVLGHDHESAVFDKFKKENISDFWLPLSSSSVAQLAGSTEVSQDEFQRVQRHFMSRLEYMSADQLLNSIQTHRHIRDGATHFKEMEKIGQGGSAEVARVQHILAGREYACKRILRADTIKHQRDQLIEFEQEVSVLQRISHRHFVSFVASFTDLSTFSLILNPVAKDVLKSMLERQSRDSPLPEEDITTLRRSFGCLTTALAFLHKQEVRHKDIKPGNILLSNGRVYLCDFGISRDWSKSENSTTEGDVLKFTRRYCAPEVFERDPRNATSDIWSLGCVFLEMISVIKGYPLEEVNSFLLEHSVGGSAEGFWHAQQAIHAWLEKLRSDKNDSSDDRPLDWIVPMIRKKPDERLRAFEVLEMMLKNAADLPHPDLYIGACCRRSDSTVDSVISTEPRVGLGIHDMPASPSPEYLELPGRNSSPTSRGRRPNASHSRSLSRDGSISPHTQSSHLVRNNTDISHFSNSPVSPLQSSPMKSVTSRSGSLKSSEPSFQRHSESITSSTDISRPPIPPPAIVDLKCECASRSREKHIFNATIESSSIDQSNPAIETNPVCEIRENKVQIYETPPEDPSMQHSLPFIWCVTRRLVISYISGNPETRRCTSFWVPLADLDIKLDGHVAKLRWSDCNQMTERRSPNYGQHYDWLYNPKQPNNSVTIQFYDRQNAEQFRDTIRMPYEDGINIRHIRTITSSPSQEMTTFIVGKKGSWNYRVASLASLHDSFIQSKLLILWPELDLDIRISDARSSRVVSPSKHVMVVQLNNISTPTYHSDTRGLPAVDYSIVARCSKTHKVKATCSVHFPVDLQQDIPVPPQGVVNMLYGLTGWTLRYFAIVDQLKSKNKRWGGKKYGRADIMLWERIDENDLTRTCGTQLTFRVHDEVEFLWISGSITSSTNIAYLNACDAVITVANKAGGVLLDTSTMTAITSENSNGSRQSHGNSHSNTHESQSKLDLTFENREYRLEFVKIVEDFKRAAVGFESNSTGSIPPPRSMSSTESVRRINSLASYDTYSPRSPPTRFKKEYGP